MVSEQEARETFHRLLAGTGWVLEDFKASEFHAVRDVATRAFVVDPVHGIADHRLEIDGTAAGVIQAKKQGNTLIGVQPQLCRCAKDRPTSLCAWRRRAAYERRRHRQFERGNA